METMESPRKSLDISAIPLPIVCYCTNTANILAVNNLFSNLVRMRQSLLIGIPVQQILFSRPDQSTAAQTSLPKPKDFLKAQAEAVVSSSNVAPCKIFTSEVVECHCPSGATFFAKLSANLDDPAMVVLAINDVTQETEEETEEQADFMRRLAQFPAMLYTFVRMPNGKQKFTYASASSRRVWNVPPEEVTAEDGAERLIAAVVDQKAFADSVELSARTLKTWNWTGECKIQDEEDPSKFHVRWLRGISEPRKLPDGTIKWNGGVFDITKEMQQKEEIERAQRSIAQEHERAEIAHEFSELLSHEVRNPLSGIDSCSQLISKSLRDLITGLDKGAGEPQKLRRELEGIKEDVNQVTQCTEYIKNVLENTLELAKMRSQKLELNVEAVDLKKDILEPTIRMFRKSPRAVNIYFRCDGSIKVSCDPFRIKQILVNLINNGIKHTSAGYVRVVAARLSAQKISLAVEDTGTGIPADKRNKVFAKYEKIKSTMNPTGHGIGLSLCQELVHKMHGTIRIDPNYPSSPFGKGTRIEMIFPFEQVELDTATYENKEEHVDLPESIRVLICDDNKLSQTLTRRRLESHTRNWTFDTCYTGEDAVEAAKSRLYGLLVIDENLHEGGGKLRGHETMRIIRSHIGETTPIIGCSANELSTLHVRSGANLVWRKPLPNDTDMVLDLSRVLQMPLVPSIPSTRDRKKRKLV